MKSEKDNVAAPNESNGVPSKTGCLPIIGSTFVAYVISLFVYFNLYKDEKFISSADWSTGPAYGALFNYLTIYPMAGAVITYCLFRSKKK